MDGDRFDRLSRTIAERSTRRQALLRLGGGGFAASLLGFAGVRSAAAQQGQTTTCELQFAARFVTGPGEGTSLSGELTIDIGPEGAIDNGTFRSTQGATFAVVGQATGRSLDMLFINTEDDQRISLNGVAARDVNLCRGGIRGTFGGPDVENLGTWRATRPATDNASPTPVGGGPGGPGGDTTTPAAPGAPTATPTPCPPVDCGTTFVQDPVTCECGCPPPYDRCGEVCCFGGATCNPDGSCMCPPGTEPCNEVCTPSCPGGQILDPSTCQCITAPIVPTETPNPCPSGQSLCNGVCMDTTNDVNNCGFCGNVCPPNMPCIAGHCQCPVDWDYCSGFCVDTSTSNIHCGSCGNTCTGGDTCVAGNCQ
jgi:hypothetical protein